MQLGDIYGRTGWDAVPAIEHRWVFEIDSSIILQPGPAALTDGLDELHRRIAEAVGT